MMLESFVGYCLVLGQMSYWGMTVLINILSIIPLFGVYVGEFIWCSVDVIINRMFIIHLVLGLIIVFLILYHLFLLHNFSSSNPLINNYSLVVSFYLLFFKDVFVSNIIGLLICYFLFLDPDYVGNADNNIEANALSTPNHILPE